MVLTPASSREIGTSVIADGAVTAVKLATGLIPLTELFDTTLAGAAATLDTGAGGFATTLDHLFILYIARTSEAVAVSSAAVTLNADAGASYDRQALIGAGAVASATETQAGAAIATPLVPGASAAAGAFGMGFLLIPAYGQTTAHKAAMSGSGYGEDTAGDGRVQLISGRWRNAAAVSRVTLTAGGGSNFAIGSRLTVYGIG